jgi:beta-lactamase superfamily II metal-dependent hydrolase
LSRAETGRELEAPSLYIERQLHQARLAERLGDILSFEPKDDLRCLFLDAGQGNCAVVRTPDGRTIVIDCNIEGANDNVVRLLKKAGIAEIDVLIATHPDWDHVSGLASLAKHFSVRELWKVTFSKTPDNSSPDSVEAFKEYEAGVASLREAGTRIINPTVDSYDRVFGGAHVEVLAPISRNAADYRDANDACLVVRISHKEKSILFAADTTQATWKELMSRGQCSATVLHASHHGSESGYVQGLMEAISPQLVVVSVGPNPHGHPHGGPMSAYSTAPGGVLRTDDGLIGLQIASDGALTLAQ